MAKKKKQEDLLDKSIPELKKELEVLRTEMAKILLEKNAGRLKNVSLYGQKKREKAKILTMIRLKELNIT